MSTVQIQQQRTAQAIAAAAEAIREAKPDADRLRQVEAEALIGDFDKIAVIVAELAEQVARQERAFTHLADHVDPSQDKEIERLRERVEELEGSSAGASKPAKKK
jgi:uncharacterized coiled-coil protein SlyX